MDKLNYVSLIPLFHRLFRYQLFTLSCVNRRFNHWITIYRKAILRSAEFGSNRVVRLNVVRFKCKTRHPLLLLTHAAANGDLKIYKWIANINTKPIIHIVPLMVNVIRGGNINICKLHEHNKINQCYIKDLYGVAIKYDRRDIYKWLLKHYVYLPTAKHDNTCLQIDMTDLIRYSIVRIIKYGRLELFKYVIIRFNVRMSTALLERIFIYATTDICKWVLTFTEDFDANDNHLLKCVAIAGRVDVCKLLIQHCKIHDATTILRAAIDGGKLDVIKWILTLEYPIAHTDMLKHAVTVGFIDSCKLLLPYLNVNNWDIVYNYAVSNNRVNIQRWLDSVKPKLEHI